MHGSSGIEVRALVSLDVLVLYIYPMHVFRLTSLIFARSIFFQVWHINVKVLFKIQSELSYPRCK